MNQNLKTITLILMACVWSKAKTASASDSDKPNVIIVMTDDQGYGDLGATGKLVYAYVTYILMMMIYTANNVPYGALSAVMTADTVERTVNPR